MSPLVLAGIGLGLLGLYLILRFESIARLFRRLCHFLAAPFKNISFACLHLAHLCQRGCRNCLPWRTDKGGEESDEHLLNVMICRMLFLIVSLILVGAEFPFARLRGAAFFGLQVTPLALPDLSVLTGLLFVLMPGTWLFLLLETTLLPRWAGLFPLMHEHKILRRCVSIIAAILLLVSLAVSFLFYAAGQCQLQDGCTSDMSLQLVTAGVFGVLLILAGAVSLWGVVLGTMALVSSILGFLYCFLVALSLACTLIADVLMHLGQLPVLSPDEHMSIHPLVQTKGWQALPDPSSQKLQPGTTTITEEETNTMANTHNSFTGLVSCGSGAARLMKAVYLALELFGAIWYIRCMGMFDPNRPSRSATRVKSAGITDASPTPQEITQAQTVVDVELVNQHLLMLTGTKVVDAFTPFTGKKGFLLVAIDSVLVSDALAMLRSVHNQLPTCTLVVMHLLEEDYQEAQVQEAERMLQSLHRDGVIDTVVSIDPRSALARNASEQYQETCIAATLASLLIAHTHSDHNLTFGQVFERLGTHAPLCGLSCASAKVATAKVPGLYKAYRAVFPKAPERGHGDIQNCVVQTRMLIDEVMGNAQHQTFPQTLGTGEAVLLQVTVPISLSSPDFAAFERTIRAWVIQKYSHTSVIITRGAGVPPAPDSTGYYISVSAMKPLLASSPLPEEYVEESIPEQVSSSVEKRVRANGRNKA